MNNTDYIKEYYKNYDEDGRLLLRHGSVEFATTMRFIDKYLFPGAQIAEIGAGTGRYSHSLANRGYKVDAVELVEHNIEIFKQNTKKNEPITIRQGNALDLSFFEDERFDITLVLGPMYHLFTKNEQLKALSEAIRITKHGGIIFCAYCMGDASVLSYGFVQGKIYEIIKNCNLNPETFDKFSKPWGIFELYRKEDIDKLRENFDVTQLHFAAADGYANHMRQTLEDMDDKTFEMYLKYHFSTCERQDMIGLSHHTLDIFRRN